jgi:DNA-binding transcriptional MerR regulator
VPELEIPNRALFKPSEVCEIASVQPYVLRSWESEFPDLGVSKGNGGSRFYRRTDVERVLRIKQLVFADGLTLAGVRRRIEEEAPLVMERADEAPIRELLGRNARERLVAIKSGLRSILEMLSSRPTDSTAARQRAAAPSRRRQASRAKAAPRRAKPASRSGRKSARSRR